MKNKNIILALSFVAMSFFTLDLYSQEDKKISKDSLEVQVKRQKNQDSDRMSALKSERRETKSDAKETRRVSKDANDAASESKSALKAEKKAQRSRKMADKQATRAVDARTKSENN